MAENHGGRGGAQGAQPASRVVVRSDCGGDGRSHVGSRVAVVASALACISGVATWVGRTSGTASTAVRADELLAAPRFGAAKAQLRAEEATVTKQLYAAEDKDAKTDFRVAKDRALVHTLEEKAERISAQLKDPASAVKPAREMMLARKNAFASVLPKGAPAAGAEMISLSDMGAIIKAVKEAEGQTRFPPPPDLLRCAVCPCSMFLGGARRSGGRCAVHDVQRSLETHRLRACFLFCMCALYIAWKGALQQQWLGQKRGSGDTGVHTAA